MSKMSQLIKIIRDAKEQGITIRKGFYGYKVYINNKPATESLNVYELKLFLSGFYAGVMKTCDRFSKTVNG